MSLGGDLEDQSRGESPRVRFRDRGRIRLNAYLLLKRMKLVGWLTPLLWSIARRFWQRHRLVESELPLDSQTNCLFLDPPQGPSEPGADLTELWFIFLREHCASVRRLQSAQDLKRLSDQATILAIPNRAYHRLSLWRAMLLAVRVRRVRIPVVVPLPDTCVAQDSLVAGIMVMGRPQSTVIILQNSWSEAAEFGLPRVTSAVLWTWPKDRWDRWQSHVAYRQRERIAMVASSGDPRRRAMLGAVAGNLESCGYQLVWTDLSMPWEEYVAFSKRASIVVTTNWMQPAWETQPLMQQLVPETVVTGRVWEAFATGSLLLCTRASALSEMGFAAGSHFLDLEALPRKPQILGDLISSVGELIARSGHAQMKSLVGARL